MSELKHCPFCGVVPKVEKFEDRRKRITYGIECREADCDIQPLTLWYADKEEAIKAWNRRADKE